VYSLRGLVQQGFISPAPLRPVPNGKPSRGSGRDKTLHVMCSFELCEAALRRPPKAPVFVDFADDPHRTTSHNCVLLSLRQKSRRPVACGRLRRRSVEQADKSRLIGGMMRIWAPMRAADYVQHQSAISLESGENAPSAQHNSKLHITLAPRTMARAGWATGDLHAAADDDSRSPLASAPAECGPRPPVPGHIQVVPDSGRRASLRRLPLCGAECAASKPG